jgi:hypothetical protein
MKYMLLMSGTKDMFEWYSKWPKEDLQANMAFMGKIAKELKEEGVLVETAGLGWPSQAITVRADSKGQPITDGVFPEAKEFLAGYWIIDVESAEEAYKIAARISLAPAPKGTEGTMPLEVREVMSRAPEECGG